MSVVTNDSIIPRRHGDVVIPHTTNDRVFAAKQTNRVGRSAGELSAFNLLQFAGVGQGQDRIVAQHYSARCRRCPVDCDCVRICSTRDNVVSRADSDCVSAADQSIQTGHNRRAGCGTAAIGQHFQTTFIRQHKVATGTQRNRIVSSTRDDSICSVVKSDRVAASRTWIDGFNQPQISIGKEGNSTIIPDDGIRAAIRRDPITASSRDYSISAIRQSNRVRRTAGELSAFDFQQFACIGESHHAVVAKHYPTSCRCGAVDGDRVRVRSACDHVVAGSDGDIVRAAHKSIQARDYCRAGWRSAAVS